MSLEYFNAENRNAGEIAVPRRCCSFCKRNGHYVNTCNHPRLRNFENICINEFKRLNSRVEFKNWLLEYSVQDITLIKAYAVSRCGVTLRTSIDLVMDSVVNRVVWLINQETIRQRMHPTAEAQPPAPQEPVAQPAGSEIPELEFVTETTRMMFSLFGQNVLHINSHNVLRDVSQNDILMSLMFLEMIGGIRNEHMQNRRFDIGAKIVECQESEKCECNICYENCEKSIFIKLDCGHEFCKDCTKQSLKNVRTENPQCAFCRAEIKNLELSSQMILDEFTELLA